MSAGVYHEEFFYKVEGVPPDDGVPGMPTAVVFNPNGFPSQYECVYGAVAGNLRPGCILDINHEFAMIVVENPDKLVSDYAHRKRTHV